MLFLVILLITTETLADVQIINDNAPNWEDQSATNWVPVGCAPSSLMNVDVLPTRTDSNIECAKQAYRLGYQYFGTSTNASSITTSTTALTCYGFSRLPQVKLDSFSDCVDTPNHGNNFIASCASSSRSCTGNENVSAIYMGIFVGFSPTGSIMTRIKKQVAQRNWRNKWNIAASTIIKSGWKMTSYSESIQDKEGCQNFCNADLSACALGYGYKNTLYDEMNAPWNPNNRAYKSTGCRCYACMLQSQFNNIISPVGSAEETGKILIRNAWGLAFNVTDTDTSGLVLRNGTILPLSLCQQIQTLNVKQQSDKFEVLSDEIVGQPTTEFSSTCVGTNDCGWQYSYSFTKTKEITHGFSMKFGAEFEFKGFFASTKQTAEVGYDYQNTRGESSTDTYNLSGTISPGQTVLVRKQLRKRTYRNTVKYNLYGGVKVLVNTLEGDASCYLNDIGEHLTDPQTLFHETQDIAETTTVYFVSTT